MSQSQSIFLNQSSLRDPKRPKHNVTNASCLDDAITHTMQNGSFALAINKLRNCCLLQRIEKEAKEEVDAAVKVAQAGPEPALDDLFLDVYADDNMEGHKIRGCDNWIRQATN